MSELQQIPHGILWLMGAGKCPGVPLCSLPDLLDTLLKLAGREIQVASAKAGLTNQYTLGGTTATAQEFLYGGSDGDTVFDDFRNLAQRDSGGVLSQFVAGLLGHAAPLVASRAAVAADPRTQLPLQTADQWGLSWTNFAGVFQRAQGADLANFSAALNPTQPGEASRRFWPTIANYGLGYNLLILQKSNATNLGILKSLFSSVWLPEWDAAAAAGLLYFIDLRIFENLSVDISDAPPRFTPATVTLLRQEAATKQLLPVAVRVTGAAGAGVQVYVEASAAWLYALLAARTSVTVYGIWLGHVYHWHMITAAMQLAMRGTLPADHPVSLLLAPQSKYLIEFDEVLLLLWAKVAPPTSVSTPIDFLRLTSLFAKNRGYFMDDPLATLERNGIVKEDFSVHTAWDQYPIVGTLLAVWENTANYVNTFVDTTYPAANPPASDDALQAWIQNATDVEIGNVQGLPPALNTNAQVKEVLTSLVYRVTMHGSARLLASSNPGLTYVANFPPCLQSATIPAPTTNLNAAALFQYLPVTGTIGSMMTFYYTFAFSRPYEPFVPSDGLESNLYFPGDANEPRNRALIAYRQTIQDLIALLSPNDYPGGPQRYQWPLSIET